MPAPESPCAPRNGTTLRDFSVTSSEDHDDVVKANTCSMPCCKDACLALVGVTRRKVREGKVMLDIWDKAASCSPRKQQSSCSVTQIGTRANCMSSERDITSEKSHHEREGDSGVYRPPQLRKDYSTVDLDPSDLKSRAMIPKDV